MQGVHDRNAIITADFSVSHSTLALTPPNK